MNLEKVKKIYFIGIGGIGMSAVAGIAHGKGFEVSGSDASDVYEPSKSVLDKHNIPYKIGYAAENLETADLVVTTAAVDRSNPEVAAAIHKNLPIVSFAELLAELVKDKKQILVVGTHGKGTTAGLLGYVLSKNEYASFFVGAVLTDLNTNFHNGVGPYFIIEGDEYKSNFNDNKPKFSYFQPEILLINNLEHDHPDLYPDLPAYKKPFQELAESLPETAVIVYNSDDKNVLEVIKNSRAKKVAFSISDRSGLNNISLKLPGQVYAYDYLAAVTVLKTLGLESADFTALVSEYSGVKRRYEIIFENSYVIVDDYAHHPSAVKQTLEATKDKYPNRRVVAFFEPHTYSRTKETLPELAKAFGAADLVYIAEVYPAREQKLPSSITGQEVVDAIRASHPKTFLVKDKEEALAQYAGQMQEQDVIVVMAVGSFNKLAYDLKTYVQQHSK